MLKGKVEKILSEINFGKHFSEMIFLEFSQLREVVRSHTETLHLIPLYARQTEVRMVIFTEFLKYQNLHAEFIESDTV